MQTNIAKYPWAQELEKIVVHSLTTTFGLDFLLFKDQLGGNVDTIHNARQGIWATEVERERFEKRPAYDSDLYHKNENYINTGRRDKEQQQSGQLNDGYRGTKFASNEKRDLDHVISAKEIHDDKGRVLAGIDGVEVANQDGNLQSTSRSINRSKGQTSIEDYLNDKLPRSIANAEKIQIEDKRRLANMPRDSSEHKQKIIELENKIRKDGEKIKSLKEVDCDEMRKKDAEARTLYERQINTSYYANSKFLKTTAQQAGLSGLKMGTRQMLGLVWAEVWFELRKQIPIIFKSLKEKFEFDKFMEHIKECLQGIWNRVRIRFNDFLISFKDGVFAGIFSSITTTVFNIFATMQKTAIKIIREVWVSLVKALKLMFFNPDKLSFVDLCKAIASVLNVAIGTIVGSKVHADLAPFLSFPFGGELAAFAGALVTGVVTLGLTYFLLHSEISQKVWAYLDSIMPYAGDLSKFKEINLELDRYLTELGKIEFNLDAYELMIFSKELANCNSEVERGIVLKKEISKRGIELPYEMGDSSGTRKWLKSLAK